MVLPLHHQFKRHLPQSSIPKRIQEKSRCQCGIRLAGRLESSAKATALSRNAGLARPPGISVPREAFGLRKSSRAGCGAFTAAFPLVVHPKLILAAAVFFARAR
jgi:hypothetical protein